MRTLYVLIWVHVVRVSHFLYGKLAVSVCIDVGLVVFFLERGGLCVLDMIADLLQRREREREIWKV